MVHPKRFTRPGPDLTPRKHHEDRPTARKPVRYHYADANRDEIAAVTVHLEFGGEDSFDTLNSMIGLVSQVKAELLYKARRYQPWSTPFVPANGDRSEEDLDPEDVADGYTPAFTPPPPRR